MLACKGPICKYTMWNAHGLDLYLKSLPFFIAKFGWYQRPSVSCSAETFRHWENRILICSVNYNLNVCFTNLNSFNTEILSTVIFCLFVYLWSVVIYIKEMKHATVILQWHHFRVFEDTQISNIIWGNELNLIWTTFLSVGACS